VLELMQQGITALPHSAISLAGFTGATITFLVYASSSRSPFSDLICSKRVSLVVFAIGFSAWFLYYGRKMYKTLEMFKGSAVNARLMDKIYFIARTTAIFTVMFVFIQIGSNVAQIAFASIHVFLPYQFLFRLQEAGYYIIIFKTFNFHEQWKVAFRSRSRSSTAATALSGKRTGSVNTGTATASKSSGSTKSGGSDELEPLTSMVL
jgi:ACR3 family arsenite efflux pump ArsB